MVCEDLRYDGALNHNGRIPLTAREDQDARSLADAVQRIRFAHSTGLQAPAVATAASVLLCRLDLLIEQVHQVS